MKLLLLSVIGLGFVYIVYLLRGSARQKREISDLRLDCREKGKIIAELQKEEESASVPVDALSTHDRVIELHALGESIEAISEALKIPQNKVAMTLKIEELKKHGAR